jgi:taurine dioxygenase
MPRPARRSCSWNAFTTHFTKFHAPANVRFGQDYEPGGANLPHYLISQAAIPEYQAYEVRFRWEASSIAIWDNRCTQHNPVNDYHGYRRVMHRITLSGDVPC